MYEAKIYYITSFNKELFATTGIHCITSFLQSKTKDNLVVCTEDFPETGIHYPNLLYHAIENDPNLLEWHRKYNEYIPDHFGGKTTKCDCYGNRPVPHKEKEHKKGCYWTQWNRNAYRWFKKVVALDWARRTLQCDFLIWVDCDCVFRQFISKRRLISIFQDKTIFYNHGSAREAVETGLIGFDFNKGGKEFIAEWMARFISGKFLEDHRWDDGYQFTIVKNYIHWRTRVNDIGAGCQYTNVAQHTPLSPFIYHNKGFHQNRFHLFV